MDHAQLEHVRAATDTMSKRSARSLMILLIQSSHKRPTRKSIVRLEINNAKKNVTYKREVTLRAVSLTIISNTWTQS